jgi:hypothetical protein
VETPRPERPHGALGAVLARRPQTSSMGSVQAKRPQVTVPTVQIPSKPSRKKSIYAEIPPPEPPHGALGAVLARRPQTSSMGSAQAKRPQVTAPTVQTPNKPSRKKSIYSARGS